MCGLHCLQAHTGDFQTLEAVAESGLGHSV